MTKEIEKLELAILSDVFRYSRVVDLRLPKFITYAGTSKGLTRGDFQPGQPRLDFSPGSKEILLK